eukprot:5203154-Pyramimonas_sp.AAC.1
MSHDRRGHWSLKRIRGNLFICCYLEPDAQQLDEQPEPRADAGGGAGGSRVERRARSTKVAR